MAGVLEGVTVLDLSWGIAGPMTGMLLGDHGAEVTKIEPPGGDPYRHLSGYQVWQRGKRSAVLDLKDGADRETFLVLAAGADVVLESFEPGVTSRLGVDYETLSSRNPRLVYCSITGYGSEGRLAGRPGIDALVAARTGQQWEARGIVGGTLARLAGAEPPLAALDPPEDLMVGAPRPGPLFGGVPWVSLGTFYLATLGISAALRAREVTGRGQRVETSLLQGALMTALWPWQRAERVETPGYQSWVIDPRAPKGFFRCSDDRWVHQWTPLPSFVLGAASGEKLEITSEVTSPRQAAARVGLDPADMIVLWEFIPRMAEAANRFRSDDWAALAAQVGVPLQPVRAPEEALDDPLLLADGCVVEIPDPRFGAVRQVGTTYHLSGCPTAPISLPPEEPGASTQRVRAAIPGGRTARTPRSTAGAGAALSSPLDGMLVLDLGLAAAGPFGAQLLGQMGARVIKVQQLHDSYWMGNHIGMACNMGKQSLGVNLKTEEGMAILHKLVERADVVHTNMRYEAAERLAVDYESLRQINPRLIYCHTRGFERGPRDELPGNDQTGAALAGTEWLEGGLDNGGVPIWPVTSLGDTGNGILSAIAVVQAVYHRDRTGEGQFVDTSIIYAHLLNTSMAWKTADGARVADRPSLDAAQLGWSPFYRLYRTADDWLCVAALTPEQRSALRGVLGPAAPPVADWEDAAAAPHRHARRLEAGLEAAFANGLAADWAVRLEAAGVPCEITNENRVVELFDDPDLKEKGWIAAYEHPTIGRVETGGLLIDFSETPGVLWGPAPLVGQHSREILTELGYEHSHIDELVVAGILADASQEITS
jgi:crotonobetainyl-CoA:carnitine CoA-transferase CaiB-like acyl-CoA transferase